MPLGLVREFAENRPIFAVIRLPKIGLLNAMLFLETQIETMEKITSVKICIPALIGERLFVC